jgi:hypothetical protein
VDQLAQLNPQIWSHLHIRNLRKQLRRRCAVERVLIGHRIPPRHVSPKEMRALAVLHVHVELVIAMERIDQYSTSVCMPDEKAYYFR